MRRLFDVIRREPVSLPTTATVRDAAESMRKHKVGAILVTTGDLRLEGIFTARDAVCRVVAAGKDPSRTTLGEVMTPNPLTVTPEKIASDALKLMQDIGCRHLPVVDNGQIVGIVSRADFRGSEQQRAES